MAVPIVRQGPYLIVPVQSALTDADLGQLRGDLLDSSARRTCKGVVIDVTALEVMDSFATRTLRGLAAMLRLRGVETVIVGIQPSVAIAMVQLGLTMAEVPTALDADDGVVHLQEKLQEGLDSER